MIQNDCTSIDSQIVFIIKCQLTMELSWSPRLKNVLAQRRTTHATQCSNRSASVRFMVCGADHGGGKRRRTRHCWRRWPASASYFYGGQLLLLSSCFHVGQLLLQTVASFCFWPAPMEGPRPHPEVYHRMR